MSKQASILQDLEFREDRPATKVLLESEFSKEIRIALRQGQLMKEHKTPWPIVIEIFDGAIDFSFKDSTIVLKRGDLITLEGGVPHSLLGRQDSVIRLSLSKADEFKRVKEAAAG